VSGREGWAFRFGSADLEKLDEEVQPGVGRDRADHEVERIDRVKLSLGGGGSTDGDFARFPGLGWKNPLA